MRKHVLLTALLVAACAKEHEAFKPLVLTASPEETTKSFLNGTTVCWSDGDAVAAYVGGVSYPSSSTLITGNTAQFTFSTLPAESPVQYAVYPASAAGAGWSDGVIIPSEQTAVANSFADGACVSIASGSGEPSAVFRNICGFLAISIQAEGVTDVRIWVNEPMTGTVDIDYNGGNPVATPRPTRSMTGVHLAGPFTQGTTYYAAVLPGTYTGLTIKLTHADGYISTYTNSHPLTVTRNDNVAITPDAGLGLRTVTSGWFEKDPARIGEGVPVVIVGKVGGEYRTIHNAASDVPPLANTTVTVSGSRLPEAPGDSHKWNLSHHGSTFTLYPSGSTAAWLYCSTQSQSSAFKEIMYVGAPAQGETNRHNFAWDAAGHIHTSDSYHNYYLSYHAGEWNGESYPAYGTAATYPAAVFSFYVQVP